MSGQGYYSDQQQADQTHPSNNPYANPWASSQEQSQQPPQQQQQQHFSAPTGPPPPQQQDHPGPPRSPTFQESDFVPESERGEQREAMEQFEMQKGRESQQDKDVAQLQQEFPSVDGALIAAIYGDSGMGAARETLTELAGATQ